MKLNIETEADDIGAQLGAWLEEQTAQAIGEMPSLDLRFSARDENGALLGGIIGRITLQVLHIQLLALAPAARGCGLGSALMQKLENAAREHGAIEAWVDTLEWEAPEFYQKHGYQIIGAVGAVGRRKYFARKSLI